MSKVLLCQRVLWVTFQLGCGCVGGTMAAKLDGDVEAVHNQEARRDEGCLLRT